MIAYRPVILTTAFVGLMACGGGQTKPATPPAKPVAAQPTYESRCKKLKAGFDQEVAAKKYLPTTLHVRHWTGEGVKKGGKLSEADYVKMLLKGGPRVTLLMSRGGLGKSMLGWALQAQTCSERVAVRIDLRWHVATMISKYPKDANVLLLVIEKRLTGVNSATPKLAIEKALKGRDLLLLFDSLDEVALDQRAKLVDWIQEVMAPVQGTSAIVFTRPPVFSANYGFAHVDARVEIPMLDCEGTRRAQRELIKDDAEHANLLKLAKKFGLDRMVVQSDGHCYYPHMATYRDIIVLRKVAAAIPAKMPPPLQHHLLNRTAVYEHFLTVSMLNDLTGLKVMPDDLLNIVDRMLVAQSPDGSKRNIGFTIGACMAQTGRTDATENKKICERLLQSTLFKETSKPDTWQFTNQSVGDLFLARWTNASMRVKDGSTNCAIINAKANLLESNEIAGFLVGMDAGQSCLLPIAQVLCKHGGDVDHNFELLDQGLPSGNARVELLKATQDAAGDQLKAGACLGDTFERLKKTVPADAFPAEEPAKKGKKKRRRKKRKKTR